MQEKHALCGLFTLATRDYIVLYASINREKFTARQRAEPNLRIESRRQREDCLSNISLTLLYSDSECLEAKLRVSKGIRYEIYTPGI